MYIKTLFYFITCIILDQWWETYGTETSNLQKLVVRILRQTCSASGCKQNWSVFEDIH
jgi:hypothetical protein